MGNNKESLINITLLITLALYVVSSLVQAWTTILSIFIGISANRMMNEFMVGEQGSGNLIGMSTVGLFFINLLMLIIILAITYFYYLLYKRGSEYTYKMRIPILIITILLAICGFSPILLLNTILTILLFTNSGIFNKIDFLKKYKGISEDLVIDEDFVSEPLPSLHNEDERFTEVEEDVIEEDVVEEVSKPKGSFPDLSDLSKFNSKINRGE